MKKLIYLLLVLLPLSLTFCVATVQETWDASKIYTPPAKISYKGGVWECYYVTQGDKPGVTKPDSSCPWECISGRNWTKSYEWQEYYHHNYVH